MPNPRPIAAAPLALVAAAVVLAACGTPEGVADPTGGAEEPDPPSSASSPPEDSEAIRDVDLGSMTWFDARSARGVPLADGAFAEGFQQWTYDGDAVYADADADGFLDALAPLDLLDGNAVATQWYLWRWDDAAGTAVQVPHAVAVMSSCGDVVHEVSAAEGDGAGGFAIRESVRLESDAVACADVPPRERTRTVTLEDGHLVRTAPSRGYGGVCGTAVQSTVPRPGFDAWQVRVAPDVDAPLVVDASEIENALLYRNVNGPMRADGWVEVGLDTGDSLDQADWPCGFIVGELAG